MSNFKVEVKTNGEQTTVETPFRDSTVSKLKSLGGKWSAPCWVLPAMVRSEVEKYIEKVYGSTNNTEDPLVQVDVVFPEGCKDYSGSLTVGPLTIARAFGRDSGAKLSPGWAQINGGVHSGGSVKNWYATTGKGSSFRAMIPLSLAKVLQDKSDALAAKRLAESKEVREDDYLVTAQLPSEVAVSPKEILLDKLQCLIQEALEVHKVTTDELKDLVCAVYEGTFDK